MKTVRLDKFKNWYKNIGWLGIKIDWLHYTPFQIEMCKKYYPDCLVGKHVPVKAIDKDDPSIVLYVICQKCFRPMTIEQHKEFFEERIKWFENKFGYTPEKWL